MNSLDNVCAQPTATLLDVLGVIDRAAQAICCIVDDDRKLLAVMTDGDVRRAILAGASTSQLATPFANASPRTVVTGTPRAHVLDMMHASKISAVPEVDSAFRLVGLHTLSEITGAPEIPNLAVIMAGGKGTRLGELTRSTPKPLMQVAGRPIIEWIILGLVGDGIRTIYVSVNHLADQIIDRLGDGEQLGCHIEYLRETEDNPLSTAGALSLLPESVTASDRPPIMVMNGDLMVDFDAQSLIAHHRATGAAITMGTRAYSHTVPFGVVEFDADRQITAITEKPTLTVEINTAIYCIDAELTRLLPYNQPSTMPDLAQSCLDAGKRVIAWPLSSEWIDIGTPTDLARAKGNA